jgi:heme/copper-type cytochrome/quinol oxidase subunit 1
MISKFSHCIISGRDPMLIALLITAVSGCIVRGHHMFMVGSDLDTRSYFSFPTSIIAPFSIKTARLFYSRGSLNPESMNPLLFFYLFILLFAEFTNNSYIQLELIHVIDYLLLNPIIIDIYSGITFYVLFTCLSFLFLFSLLYFSFNL